MSQNKGISKVKEIAVELVINIIVVGFAAVIGFAGVMFISYMMYVPKYTSTATIVVNAKGNQSSSLYGVSVEMAEIFSKVIVDPAINEKAAAHLNRESFDGTLTAKPIEGKNVVELEVTSNSPQTSYELLTAVLEVYPDLSISIFENAIIEVSEQPSVPEFASNTGVYDLKGPLFIGYFVCMGFMIIASIGIDIFKIVNIIKRKT